MRLIILVVSIALAAAAAQTPSEPLEPSVVRLLPTESGLLLGVNWRKVLDSESGQLLHKQLAGVETPFFPMLATVQKMLLEDVDALFLFVSLRDVPAAKQEAPMLVVVKGRFNRARVRSWVQGKPELHGKVELLTPSGAKPPTLRIGLLDPQTLLFGDRREVTAAIDRNASGASKRLRTQLLDRAAGLSSRYQIWFAVEAPAAGFPKSTGPAAPLMSELKGLDLGMSFSRGLDLQASLWAKSEPSAASLVGVVQGLLAMAALEQSDPPEVKDALKRIAVRQENSAVRVSLTLTESELKALQQIQSQPRRTAPVVAAAPASKPPDPNRRRTIRILGMDQGSVDVPVGPK